MGISGASAILWGCNASLPGCAPPGRAVMTLGENQIYQESGRKCPYSSGCDVACGMSYNNVSMLSFSDFEKRCNNGAGSSVHPVPSSGEMEEWSRELLSVPKSSIVPPSYVVM